MINLNYYLYFYAIFAISTNSADVLTQFDSYTDTVVSGIDFIDFNHPNHPMEYCKKQVGHGAIWIGYYDNVIPSNICRRHISCRANDVPDREFIGVNPEIGARCQRRTQNANLNFGYGCYEGYCVPITCMDEKCWQSTNGNQEEQNSLSRTQNALTPADYSDQRHSRKTQQNHYFFPSGSPYRPPPAYTSPPQNTNQQGTIIHFSET